MNQSNTMQLLQTLTEQLTGNASVQKVYGAPIVSDQKTIIPVATVKVGFGGGFGQAPGTRPGKKTEAEPNDMAGGAGMGGGLIIKPVGVLEITPRHTRYLPLGAGRYVVAGIGVGLLLGGLLGRRYRR